MDTQKFTLIELASIKYAIDNQICENAKLVSVSKFMYDENVRLNAILKKIDDYIKTFDNK